jgi:hypothetical protein
MRLHEVGQRGVGRRQRLPFDSYFNAAGNNSGHDASRYLSTTTIRGEPGLRSRPQISGAEIRPAALWRMAIISDYTIAVTRDPDRRGRYRWSVSEGQKMRDKSLYSFASKREAEVDVQMFVVKLAATWKDQ